MNKNVYLAVTVDVNRLHFLNDSAVQIFICSGRTQPATIVEEFWVVLAHHFLDSEEHISGLDEQVVPLHSINV